MATQVAHISPTALSLEKAALRLELAESVHISIVGPRQDGTFAEIDADELDAAEAESAQARATLRAMVEQVCAERGWVVSAERLERLFSI